MPGKHNAGGCKCCAPTCPSVTCSITSGTLSYTVSGATSTYIEKICGSTSTTITVSPANGSGTTSASDASCVYFVVATNGTCETRKSCVDPTCVCAGRSGYVVVDLAETPGSSFTSDNSGTYYAVASGANCLWTITKTNADFSQWSLERRNIPAGGVRLVFTLLFPILLGGGSVQITKVFSANYCVSDDTYTFGPFSDGSTFTFTIRG